MNPTKRPGPVTAVAVMCFVFGGLGLVGSLCNLSAVGLISYLIANPPPPAPPGQPDFGDLIIKGNAAVPTLRLAIACLTAVALIFCVLEIIAGTGVMKMRYWGRKLVIAYAVCSIAWTAGESVYNFTVIQPQMTKLMKTVEEWTKEQAAKAGPAGGKGGAEPPPPMFVPGGSSNSVLGGIGIAVNLLWPGIILWIMLMPKTRKAFAVANGDAEPDAPEDDRYSRRGDDVVRRAPERRDDSGPPPDDEFRYTARDE